MIDPARSRDWKEIVKNITPDEILANNLDDLSAKVNIDRALLEAMVKRVKDPAQFRSKWSELRDLAEGNLPPKRRQEVFSDLAERLGGFVGWEGDPSEGPGW